MATRKTTGTTKKNADVAGRAPKRDIAVKKLPQKGSETETMTTPSPPKGPAGPAPASRLKGRPAALLNPGHEPDDSFVALVLDCFPLSSRAMAVTLAGVCLLDLSAVLAHEGVLSEQPGWTAREMAAVWTFGLGCAVVIAAAGLLATIQIHYTFEHAGTRKRHFYELKLARFDEACSELKSLSVKDAVEGVRTVLALRGEIAGLDRRMVVETLVLRRKQRDLVWSARAVTALAFLVSTGLLFTSPAAGLAASILPFLMLALALAAYALMEVWVGERLARVRELLAPTPPEIAGAFNPSPPLEAAVERLLRRVNDHFNRLKGPNDTPDDESESQ